MHSQVLGFLQWTKARYPVLLAGGRVLECGAYDVNGSARSLFQAAEYVGLDWRAGPGVDVVGLAHEYQAAPFDVVVSTEMLEHDPHWRDSLANMVHLLRPGGSLILTCAAPGRGAHEVDCAPEDGYYHGLSVADVVGALGATNFEHIHSESHSSPSDSYVLAFRRLPEAWQPRVSVIVPAVGNVDLTKRCIDSLWASARLPLQVILIDNGSLPENSDALAEFNTSIHLRYDRMLGYPAAVNRGIEVAGGEYVCLLNNDTEMMTDGWDERLIKTLHDADAAIVSPVTDFIANPPQHVDAASDGVAEAGMLFFVCVLMRRDLFAQVGMLDEQFGLGNSEDIEFSYRVRAAGSKLVIEPSVFVHHAGHGTFRRLQPNMFQELLRRNKALLEDKVRRLYE